MRIRIALTVVLASFALAACGSTATTGSPATTDSTTTSAKPDKAELLAWVDQVCGISVTSLAPMQTQPTLDQSNAAKIKTQFVDYLTKASQALGKGLTDLEPLKKGPSKDSERYVGAHADTLTTLKTTMDASIKKVQDLSTKDPLQFSLGLQGIGSEIQSAGFVASSSIGVLVEKDLADAEKKAPNCQKLAAK
jgi:predicted small secreted protein